VGHDFADQPARAAEQLSSGTAARFFDRRPDPLKNPAPLIKRIYSYVAYRIGDGPDAEDITSEVFERAVRYRSSYEASRGEPVAWLIGIARRTLADRHGRPSPPTWGEGLEETAESVDVEASTIRRLTLDQAIENLSDRDQDLLSLRFGADLKARQIATVLQLETHAVEVALGRAVGRLRELVGDDRF
jgi:RNA polymerase sigma-70 factor (ECF subfamily)